MGILWRLLAPKPLKRARRTVRKATHPVHTVTRAVTPKPVKKPQRAAHPLSLAELKAQDAVVNAVRGKRTRRSARKRAPSRRPAGRMAAERPVQIPQQRTAEQPQRPGQLAARYARRQAEAPGRAAADRARDAARRERKAAFKAARGPWRWPEWTLAAAVAAFVAFTVLAIAAGTQMPSAAGVPLFLIWALGGLVGIPAVIWRWYRARRAATAMLAAARSQANPQAPLPGTWT
jgi:hypothetical protein